MMTQELNVCVVAAPLAAIDRRALSQAWYSALHCASAGRSETVEHRKAVVSRSEPGQATRAGSSEHSRPRALAHTNAGQVKSARIRDRGDGPDGGRRARRSPLARRIERKFLDPRTAAQRATFLSGGKRVHVVVHASPGQVRLVAVCPPAIRETVARALAQARFALASRGLACS